MSANLNKHLSTLSKRGPHRVLTGDLSYAGLEGKVYAPAEGNNLPAVAFGHDWMKKIKNYHGTLRHLASWGIVVVAPETQTGLIPDHRSFAADLESALQIAAGVKLGQGNITVSPAKLGVIGHGMGGGAAVLAAVQNPKVKTVAAIYPAKVSPSAEAAAKTLSIPGLIIGSQDTDVFNAGNPAKLAYNWKGEVAYREIDKGTQLGFSEDNLLRNVLGLGKSENRQTEMARGLVTGFLLHQLEDEGKYSAFSDPEATAKKLSSLTGDQLALEAGVPKEHLHANNSHKVTS